MTTLAHTDQWSRCHRAARTDGVAPAVTELAVAVLPGLLPCGPAGHAIVSEEIAAGTSRVWADGVTVDRSACAETALGEIDLPGGPVLLQRHRAPGGVNGFAPAQRAAWTLGLVWLRLGLSEELRETAMRYLNGRRTGNSTLLQQQMVKSTVADGLIEHLEVRAVLTGIGPGELPDTVLNHLHAQLTQADRALVKLLGASGYLAGGPGQVARVSELLAEAYCRPEEWL
ncbi:DUF2786 domain-containing protein [Umezawaea endophytica]|uniref:DUF2786 domain-containing protein n=1 Tax=Umezawaea endophytica TaxID=1654476 RepID=A0A9X2VSZ4_9PSEU|nr:DUF2786 domain-containing protein [Umezawaea endophytica]MCS7481013.1 DUF2786 domain-containing protein [Umezawaea endophytica]